MSTSKTSSFSFMPGYMRTRYQLRGTLRLAARSSNETFATYFSEAIELFEGRIGGHSHPDAPSLCDTLREMAALDRDHELAYAASKVLASVESKESAMFVAKLLVAMNFHRKQASGISATKIAVPVGTTACGGSTGTTML